MSERIERVVTSGTFSLDGGCWDVDNNVWIVGNDSSVIIIDPAHDVDKISRTVAGRTVEKILLTHAHDDHIRSAKEAAERFGAPVYLNPADRVLWEMVYPSWDFDHELADGDVLRIGDTELTVLATPGHSPGSVCFYAPHPQLGKQRRRRLLRRYPLQRWPRRNRTLLQRLRHHHRVDLDPTADPARVHGGPYRPWRQHRHRPGGARAARMD